MMMGEMTILAARRRKYLRLIGNNCPGKGENRNPYCVPREPTIDRSTTH